MTRWFDSNITHMRDSLSGRAMAYKPSIKSSLFYFVIPDALKREVVSSSAAT
jgi:hypothetical protein